MYIPVFRYFSPCLSIARYVVRRSLLELKGVSMSIDNGYIKPLAKLGLLLMMGMSLSAGAGFLGFGGTSWKEEVLLHDGSKIIVSRSVERGGRHEVGQSPPIREQSLNFVLPSINQRITWKSEFSEDVGLADFQPLLLDIFQGTAYVVTHPVGCLAYNKWGRPNPPYVIFKYEGKEWKRIPLQELPAEIKTPNLIFSSPDSVAKQIPQSPISAETIKAQYEGYKQPEYKTILREPLPKGNGCPIPTNGKAEPIGPIINGEILYYNWWPLAKDWLKNKYGESK
jgi:hypothetical protein